ncbi:MAG: hypothetical protein HKP09_02265, partial [Enterobacterales bacterium]|nr:hypothetical protein [Enterobacterales bacterium]
ISSFFSEQITRYALLLSLVFVVPVTLGLVLPLEASQGYRLIIVTMPFIALFMTIFVPLIHGAELKLPLIATTTTLAIALILAIYSPLYSEHRPQHVNIIYFEQLGTDEGYYWLQHRNPLPEQLQTAHEWSSEKKALVLYSSFEYSNWYQTEASGFEEVQYTIKSDQSHDTGRTLELGLTSPRNARTIQLVLPATTKLASFRLDGNEFKPQQITDNLDERYYFLRFDGVYEREVPLTLELGSSEPIEAFLIDRSTELPRSASKLLEQRSKVLSPQHTGDRAILIKTITL